MMSDALLCASALSLMEGRSRREWKSTLQTLRLIDVSWGDLLSMSEGDAWKWLGWHAARLREWGRAVEIARAHLAGPGIESCYVVSELDGGGPAWLRKLSSVPWVFYRGDLSILDQPMLGFSGQRDAGEQSLLITAALGREAAKCDFTVVSGGARGIDMAAHMSTLEDGGATAVILPQGLATWRAPYGLAHPRTLALSEDVPWELWSTESAMRRNRMIVDMARVFVVPQSGTSGGSHSTGMYALRQGKVTWVPDLGPQFPGNQKLLQQGARPLISSEGKHGLGQMLVESTPVANPTQQSLF